MAAEFQGTQTTLQPTALEQPIPTNVFDQGASVFGQASADSVQQANVQGARVAPLVAQASAAFDKTLDIYNKYAEQKAAEDAQASIKFDGNHNIVPPSSFYPPGISSRAYAESFKANSLALYKGSAEQELLQHSALLREQFPSNPTAYAAGMADKTKAMQLNLDPTVAPWIDLRSQQIQSQGITQLAVANQSVQNVVNKEAADRDRAAITTDVARMATGTALAKGGGGALSGYDNNIGNITNSADGYAGGKGLPYLHPNGLKFETFQSAEEGVAAAYILARKKVEAAGGTISFTDFVKKWDPNIQPANQANYAAALAKAAGALPGANVPIDDPAKMAGVLKAMNGFEKGKQSVSDAAFENGIKLAQGDKSVTRSNLATDQPSVADPKAMAEVANNAVNSTIVLQRIADMETKARAAGMQQPEIDRNRREIVFNAQMEGISEQIRNSGSQLYGSDGNVNPGAIDATQKRIDEIAKSYPGREALVRQTLTGALNEAQTSASRQAAQIQVNDQRTATPIMRQMLADQAAAKAAALSGDTVTAGAITRSLEQQTRKYLTDTSLSDGVAMKLAGAGFSAGAVSRAALQEGNTNRLEGLNAVVHDPTMNPAQKAMAYESAKAIRNDPEVFQQLTASQRAYLQGTTDDYVKVNYATQLGAFNSEILKGGTNPAKVAEVRQMQIEKGILQPQDVIAAGQIDAAANKLYREKQTQSTQAAEVVQNYQDAKPSSPEQIAAHKAELNWKPPGGGPTVDLANPAHIAAVQEHYQKYGYLPDAAVSALNSMKLSPDENAVAGPKALFETIRQVERQQADKLSGNPNTDPDKDAMIEANVASAVGKNYSFLKNATLFDAVAAHKVAIQVGPEPGKAGAAGQTPDQLNSSLDQAGSNLERMLSKRNLGLGAQLASDPASLFRSDQDMTGEQQALKAAGALVSGGSLLSGNQGYENVRIDPNVMQAFKDRGTVRIAFDGKALHASQGPDGSVENHVMNTVFADAIKNGELSATRSADGKTLNVGWQTLGSQFSKAIGVPITAKMEQGVAAGLVEMEHLRTGGTLTDVNQDYVSVLPYQAKNGQQRYLIAEKDRNGNTTTQLDLAKDDPRIAVQAIAAIKSATQAVVANAADPEIYGKALAAGGVASGVGALALIKDGDIAGNWTRLSTAIGSTVQQMQIALNRPDATRAILGDRKLLSDSELQTRKNYQTETAQMLQQLDASLKKVKDAPDLTAVLTHMMDEHLPGVDDSRLRQLIKDAGFYQPGREPRAPYKSPTRVGP